MSFKDLNIIKDLLPILTKSELRLLKRLVYVEYNKPVSENLINLISKLENPKSAEFFENKVFETDLDRRRKADDYGRIKDVISHSIILDLLAGENENYSAVFSKKFKITLLINYAEIIKSRGALRSAIRIIDRCEKDAKKYQLYDQIIDILYIKSDIGFNGSKYYKLDDILSDINYYENCRKRVKEAKIIYRDYFAKTVKKGIQKGNEEAIKNSIRKLEKYYAETSSNLVLLKCYLFKMELYLITQQFEKGTEIGLKAIKSLEANDNVRTNSRIGYFHFNIAENELGATRFKKSLKHAKKASTFVSKNSLNMVISSQFRVLALLYLNKKEEVEKVISQTMKLKILDSYPFYQSKFRYYQAVLYFIQEDFDQAWKTLSLHFDLEKDKEGWRVWLSIMRMLCQIERRELVDLDLMVQTFKKYIKSWEARSEIREREKLVFKVIETLNRNDFDFEKTKELEADTLTLLRSNVSELKWRPNSPELVIFHDWFNAKCEKRPYKPNYQPYKLKKKVAS